MRVYRLLGLLLVMVWASAAGASTDCTAPIPSEPSQAFLYVTDCGSAAHLGFATRWQPSGGTTQLSLPRTDQTEGLSYTAVWVQTAAGEDLVHAQDQTDAALQRAARLAFAQSLAPAAILDRTDSDDGRAILLTLSVPEPDNPWLYRNHDLLVFGREDGRIVTLTRVRSRITAPWTSRVLVAVATLAGLSFLYRGLTDSRRRNGSHRRLFAGPTGRMSLANTQIAFFSTIVFVLSVQHLARTGTVGDLSVEVLGLLGILAVGSATGRVADIRVERLGLDNWLWLRQQKWLRDDGDDAPYSLSQLFGGGTGGIDIFRVQAIVFSMLVGAYLLTLGSEGLSNSNIPESILGLLGLSQATYIGGKIVGPPKWPEFDEKLTSYRKLVAETANPGTDPAVQEARARLRDGFEVLFGYPPQNA